MCDTHADVKTDSCSFRTHLQVIYTMHQSSPITEKLLNLKIFGAEFREEALPDLTSAARTDPGLRSLYLTAGCDT